MPYTLGVLKYCILGLPSFLPLLVELKIGSESPFSVANFPLPRTATFKVLIFHVCFPLLRSLSLSLEGPFFNLKADQALMNSWH